MNIPLQMLNLLILFSQQITLPTRSCTGTEHIYIVTILVFTLFSWSFVLESQVSDAVRQAVDGPKGMGRVKSVD